MVPQARQPFGWECRFSLNAGEAFQKIVERVASLKVVEQALHRDPGADENGCSSQNVGIGADYGFQFHRQTLERGFIAFRKHRWRVSRAKRFKVMARGRTEDESKALT